MDDHLVSHLVPGASVAVLADGAMTTAVAGVTDVDIGAAVTESTPFRVASVIKMYMAATVLRLVERGDLNLDVPVTALGVELPETLAFAGDVTLRQLLSHTSGFSQTFTDDRDRHRSLSPLDQLHRMPPPACDPGACWSYADANFVMVQLAVESVLREPFEKVAERELFTPLGLSETRLIDAASNNEPLPAQYALVHDASNQPVRPKRVFEQALPRTLTLTTSARDAARFASALLGGDILTAETRAAMTDISVMRDVPCHEQCPFPYGLGLFRYDLGGHRLFGHDGGSGAVVAYDPDTGLAVAILTNGGEQDLGAFLNGVLQAVGSKPAPHTDA